MLINAFILFSLSFLIVCYSIKKIIYISHMKHLFDEPSEIRKVHKTRTPNLGGVAIFASMMFMSCLYLNFTTITNINYVIFAALALFILGLTDDLVGVDSTKKIAAHIGVVFMMVVIANYRITDFHGFLGIHQVPYAVSVGLSMVFFIFLINAFNLIDGINCLAAGIGLLACIVLGICFWEMKQPGWFYISVSLGACLAGFLLFNKSPARIFLGDTGSTFIGLVIGWLSINFMEANKPGSVSGIMPVFQNAPAIILSLLIIPIFDTLRVFSMRLMKRKSPFAADRNHVHHRLIDLELTHLQATGVLLIVNIGSLLLVALLGFLNLSVLITITLIYILTLNWILSYVHNKKVMEQIIVPTMEVQPTIITKYQVSVHRETVDHLQS